MKGLIQIPKIIRFSSQDCRFYFFIFLFFNRRTTASWKNQKRYQDDKLGIQITRAADCDSLLMTHDSDHSLVRHASRVIRHASRVMRLITQPRTPRESGWKSRALNSGRGRRVQAQGIGHRPHSILQYVPGPNPTWGPLGFSSDPYRHSIHLTVDANMTFSVYYHSVYKIQYYEQ